MRKNKQKIFDSVNGDCMRASLTSMLGLPNDPNKIPLPGATDFFIPCYKFLARFGLFLKYDQTACWKHGLWMASVKSKNFPKGTHAIVMNGDKVAWDPSTKKRYRVGQSLLGKDVVLGGHSLEVIDPSKLYKLREFQKLCANEK
jgi:hypothetical protein